MPDQVPDFSMAGREPPHMGPMAHGFAALGEAAERAVSTISALAADAAQAPSRLGNIARLLTADGKLGTVWQVTLPVRRSFARIYWGRALRKPALGASTKGARCVERSMPIANDAGPEGRNAIVDAAPVVAFAAIAAGGSFLLFWDRGLIFSDTGTFRMVAT